MNRWTIAWALAVVAALPACGGSGAPFEPLASSSSAIEDGAVDTADTFAVAVVQESSELIFCSGVLLAPNLVATARHCVAQLPSSTIVCASSTFGAVLPLTDFGVSIATELGPHTSFVGVTKIIVPSGTGQDKVCGNDIALMVLDRNITVSKYVEPIISPPMTNHMVYSTEVTAIGYGLSTPTDEAGVTAGVRRIKENIGLTCIPNDPDFADCFSNPVGKSLLTASEFISGDDSTCEGDSGSGAYEQSNFNAGRALAFGVLSRGGLSADGTMCVQPIYSRFDAWASLLTSTAVEAASIGGYAVPDWAGGTSASSGSDAGGTASSGSGSGASSTAGASGEGSSSASGAPAGLGDGVACNIDSDCVSQKCLSPDNGQNFYCASPCDGTSCPAMFTCEVGYCFPQPSVTTTSSPGEGGGSSHGCSTSPGLPDKGPGGAFAGLLMLAGLFCFRRPLRRSA